MRYWLSLLSELYPSNICMCYACLYYNCACKAVGKLIKRDISLHNDDSKVDAQIIVLHLMGIIRRMPRG